jgi:MscS family membrane protein
MPILLRGLVDHLMNANSFFMQASMADKAARSGQVFSLPSWIPEPVSKLWALLDAWPIIGAAIIALVALVLASVTVKVLKRVSGQITSRTSNDVDDRFFALIQKPVFLTVFIQGLGIAVRSLGLSEALEINTVRLLNSILIMVWIAAAFPFMSLLLSFLGNDKSRFKIIQDRTIPLFNITSKILIIGFGIYVLLKAWAIDVTAWLASAGVVGIALGFAAKDTLANLFSGFFIIADAPYKLGDYIVLDSGERGVVTNVGIRSTRLLTRDDIEIILPNAIIANGKIINETGGVSEKSRIRIKVGAAYGSDVDHVCEVLQKIADDHPDICKNPAPRVRMRAFGSSSLDFELLCWIKEPVLRGRLSHDLYMNVYKAFNKAGIEIPYSKHDVYVKEMPVGMGRDQKGSTP